MEKEIFPISHEFCISLFLYHVKPYDNAIRDIGDNRILRDEKITGIW